MNILIFSWRGPKHPNAGGAEICTHEHAKGWVKKGHSVTLFTSLFHGGKKYEEIDGVKIIRQGRQILEVQFKAFKWYLFGKHPKFDLVIDQFHGIPFFTPSYVKVKKLAFIHEVTKEVWRLNPWLWPFNKIVAIIGILFEPVIFKLYRQIPFMTVSKSTQNDLIAWGVPKKQITVIYNGVNVPRVVKPAKKEYKKTLIFLGALSKDKGIEEALKIFQIINQKEVDRWQFWIIGKSDQNYLNNLKSLSLKLGINKRIKFFGYVSEKKKFQLLAKSHILLHPSIREGWGLVVMEAAALGVPTVAYNVSGLSDSIINNITGLICDKDTDQIADKILMLTNELKRYKLMCDNATVWSKKFSWDKSQKNSLKLIENL